MKRVSLLLGVVLWTGSAAATEAGHCDSKPFTLRKPTTDSASLATSVSAPVAAPVPKPAPPKPAPPKTAQAKTSKYVIGCKQPKG